MELTSIYAGSGQIKIQIPSEWVRRALLEGGDKLTALIEAVKEIERFDFKHVVYPKLLAERERREKLRSTPVEKIYKPLQIKIHTHLPATLGKKAIERGAKPYCILCGESLTNPNL